MRWNDAAHVDRMTLLARRPVLGWCYALAGAALLLLAPVVARLAEWWLAAFAAVALLLWFTAWWQVVGRLWRQPLVLVPWSCSILYLLRQAGGGA